MKHIRWKAFIFGVMLLLLADFCLYQAIYYHWSEFIHGEFWQFNCIILALIFAIAGFLFTGSIAFEVLL